MCQNINRTHILKQTCRWYYFGYTAIKKIGDCENIYSVNPLYLIIGKVDRHIECNSVECSSAECNFIECNSIEERNRTKYLVFDSTGEVLKKYAELWDGIKSEVEAINGGKKDENNKDFIKITFNTDD